MISLGVWRNPDSSKGRYSCSFFYLPTFERKRESEKLRDWIERFLGDMAAHKIGSQVARAEHSIIKEICYGLTISLIAGGLWKMHHWNYQKRTREFYDLLDKGVINVVVDEE